MPEGRAVDYTWISKTSLPRLYHFHATNSTVADMAEESKPAMYTSLEPGYSFIPLTIETLGAIGKRSLARNWATGWGYVLAKWRLCSCAERERNSGLVRTVQVRYVIGCKVSCGLSDRCFSLKPQLREVIILSTQSSFKKINNLRIWNACQY